MRRTPILLACSLLAACPGGDDTTDTAVADSGTASTGSTSATSTDTEPTTGTATSVESADGTSTGSSTGPGEGSGSATGGPNPLDPCMETCAHLMDCELAPVPNCGIPCAMIESDVAGCENEYIAQQECVAELTCEEAAAWLEGDMLGGDYPCAQQDVAFQACLP